jgi:hypothetical protein
MLVALDGSKIVGLRAFMRWRFRSREGEIHAVRAVDTSTHPDHQGKGIFRLLTTTALERLPTDVDLVFNTPNEQSGAGYLKMGWKEVGRVPISLRIRRPLRFASRVRDHRGSGGAPWQVPVSLHGAIPAAEALADPSLPGLLERAERPDGWATDRTIPYLSWRYVDVPDLDYRSVAVRDGNDLRGLAFIRIRPRGRLAEATVSEALVAHGDVGGAAKLLRAVAKAAPVDHVAVHVHEGSAIGAAALRAGFVRVPQGMRLVVNPRRAGILPDPTDLRSWGFSLGDLEVF